MLGFQIRNICTTSLRVVLILCTFSSFSYCLYEDQIGKFDWLQSYVGKLKYAVPDESGKKVIVATEQNVVATLTLKTGQIVWRQVLEKDEQGCIHFLATSETGDVVVVSGDSRGNVRVFDSNTGALLVEWLLPVNIVLDRCHFVIINQKLQLLVPARDQNLEVYSYNIRNGLAGPQGSVPFGKSIDKCVIAGLYLACVDQNHLFALNLSSQPPSNLHFELPYKTVGISSVSSSGVPAVLIQYVKDVSKSRQIVLLEGSTFGCEAVKDNAAVQVISPENANGKIFLVQIVQDKEVLNIFTNDCANGNVIQDLSGKISWPSEMGTLNIAADMCGVKKDTSYLCRLLLDTDDHGIALLQVPGKVAWVREEALTSISLVEILDLPVSETDVAIEKEFDSKEAGFMGMCGRRIASQALQLQHLLQTVFGLQETSSRGQRVDLVRDEFGLHKMIVIVTKANKLYGIDNLSGEIVWQSSIPGVDSSSVQLFVERTTRHAPLPAQCALLLKDSVTQEGVLFTFNPMTGVGNTRRLGYRVVQVLQLPIMDSENLRGLVLLDSSEQLHAEPKSGLAIASSMASTTYMYVANSTSGLISGYSLAPSTSQELRVTKVWEVLLQPTSHTILTVVGKSPQEKVHSQGRVLADRSVLYKYVNPNLVAVITLGADPVHKYVLNVFLLDVVSGAVVFSVSHKRAREPVHLVHTENWLVYSYFSEKWRRTEIAAIELYEGKTQSNTAEFSSLINPIHPIVERQSYIFPAMVQAMRATVTEKGITSRHILVGLTNGMVLELPWMFVDPRRPVTVTAEMREEGIIPYMPELPIPAESIINYNRTLPRISGIYTAPSGLESTSLVLVYGLDLFYTRVAPSKTFDLLKEDFDPFLISMVLIALCVASYVTRKLASRKALKQAWK